MLHLALAIFLFPVFFGLLFLVIDVLKFRKQKSKIIEIIKGLPEKGELIEVYEIKYLVLDVNYYKIARMDNHYNIKEYSRFKCLNISTLQEREFYSYELKSTRKNSNGEIRNFTR